MIVCIPHLTKVPLNEIKITVKSLQEHPVVLVTDDRSTLVEADHPPDEGTSEFSWAPRVAHQKLQHALLPLRPDKMVGGYRITGQ